jgi:Meckel syndrome type 1 protein
MNRRIEPLSPEERDLAERIARLGGVREPAPALDAMILAAARAAVAEDAKPAAGSETPPATPSAPKVTPIRPRRTVPRWPWGMGLAASVVLAAGIGWKLQGDGEGSSAEKSASVASAVYHDEATEAVMIEQAPAAMPPPPPPLEAEADAGALARRVAQAPAEPVAKAAPGGSADAFAADAPMADAAVASSTPAAPAAQQAAEPEISINRESKGVVDLSGTAVPRSGIASDRAVGAAEYTRTPLDQRREQARPNRAAAAAEIPAPPPPPAPAASPRDRARNATGELRSTTGEMDKVSEAYDDRPPVSADSPEFRQAWLQRIRAQLARGENAAAAENLQSFRRRYPDVELPEDLRKLAATLPPPAP